MNAQEIIIETIARYDSNADRVTIACAVCSELVEHGFDAEVVEGRRVNIAVPRFEVSFRKDRTNGTWRVYRKTVDYRNNEVSIFEIR